MSINIVWLYIVIILTVTENIQTQSSSSSSSDQDDLPLTKSLGFSIRQRLGKNLDDRISKEFFEMYEEAKKASQESFNNFHVQEKRLRRVVTDEGYDLTQEEGAEGAERKKRRSANKLQSVVGKRRERSQAVRREKLNSQSLRSHMHHAKLTNLEFSND